MPDLTFRLVISADGATAKLKAFKADADSAKKGIEKPSDLFVLTEDASGKLRLVAQEAETTHQGIEKPAQVKIDATQSLATIRDITIAVQGVMQAVSGITRGLNALLDAELAQRRALILARQAFGDAAGDMASFASAMQEVTNFGDEQLLALMAKLGSAFKLSTSEIRQLTPVLLDFTEAFSATGMTAESAFDLMGRALMGNTEMLGRYGIELDKTRLELEGVSYLVEKLSEDYGGTAAALADLRTQNANAWGDIKETVGAMLAQVFNPVLKGIKALMDGFNSLSPVMKGVVTGLGLAIPVIVSLATSITALTAAVTALKTAINPVVGIISLVTGAVVTGAVAVGSYAAAQTEAAAATQTMASSIEQCGDAVQAESVKFDQLATRLLDLRSKTQRTNEEKAELKTLITQINDNYGEYLGNIDLERASYDQLATAINNASMALVQKKVVETYGAAYNAQAQAIADQIVALKKLDPEYQQLSARLAELNQKVEFFRQQSDQYQMGLNIPALLGDDGAEYTRITARIQQITNQHGQLQKAKNELEELRLAYQEAYLNLPSLDFSGGGGGGGGGGASPATAAVDAELAEFQRLTRQLDDYTKGAYDKLDAEYDRRHSLIVKHTEADSEAQKKALADLNKWFLDENTKIGDNNVAAMQASFRAEIDYYSNLESLGVSSYDALKSTMDAYYTWASENLPDKERQLVLAQLRETNLAWGRHHAEKQQKEEAHQRELQRIRDEFSDRDLELANNTYALQIRALERYYAERKDKLIEAGLTEEEITRQHNAALLALQINAAGETLGGVSRILSTLAGTMDKENAKGFKAWKGLAIAQAIVDALTSANAAYKSMAGIPVAGPGLGIAAAAAALAAGYVNVKKISETEYTPRAAEGGYLIGAPHSHGGTVIEAEGGEYIVRKDRVSALGRSFFDFVNSASLASLRGAFANFALPHIPMPAYAGSFAASGGYVSGSNPNSALIDEIRALRDAILGARPTINVSVDPLSSDPVKISEIAERGSRIRSRF